MGAALILGLGLGMAGVTALMPAAVAQERAPFGELRSALVAGGSELGVTIRDLTGEDVSRQDLTDPSGAYVERVREGSAAARAGFQAGDIVLSFDSERVRSARQLARLVDETPPGRQIEVTVLRAGSRLTLGVAPTEAQSALARAGALAQGRRLEMPNLNIRPFTGRDDILPLLPFSTNQLGVSVQELAGQLGQYFGAADGVLVTSVSSGTPAEAAGLKAGDVITKVGDATVGSVGDLRRRLGEASGEVAVTIVRERQEQTVTVPLGAARTAIRTRRVI
jgi:serine protease Do